MSKLNCAVIGLGRLGLRHAETLAGRIPEARLVGVSDASPEKRHQFVERFPSVAAFADHHALVASPDVEAVVIASPTTWHAEMVLEAMRARKAIFCEKPLTLEAAEASALRAEETRTGAFVQVGFMRRFDRAYAAAQRSLEAGELGRPVYIHCISRDPDAPPAEFLKASGGILADLCVHDIDLARWLTGSEVASVYAQGGVLLHERVGAAGDLDQVDLLLRFANGALGHIEGSRNARYGYDIRTEVVCTGGTLLVGELNRTPCMTLDRRGSHRDVVPGFLERFEQAYENELRRFVQCVREGLPSEATVEDGLRTIEVVAAGQRSLELERRVDVNPVP